jgi:hypothetical protein
MKCDGCGNEHAIRLRTYFDNVPGETTNKQMKEVCDKCGTVCNTTACPDVYFKEPYFDEHLGDQKHPYGQHIKSKAHKARIMREQNVHEYGDRVRGARAAFDPRTSERNLQAIKSRGLGHLIRE